MSFKDINTEQFKSKRENPLTTEGSPTKDTKVIATKSIKILQDDHKKVKALAFNEERKIYEVNHDAIKMYEMVKVIADELGISPMEAARQAMDLLKK